MDGSTIPSTTDVHRTSQRLHLEASSDRIVPNGVEALHDRAPCPLARSWVADSGMTWWRSMVWAERGKVGASEAWFGVQGRKGGREEGKEGKEGRKGGRKGGREEGRKGGSEEARKGGRGNNDG